MKSFNGVSVLKIPHQTHDYALDDEFPYEYLARVVLVLCSEESPPATLYDKSSQDRLAVDQCGHYAPARWRSVRVYENDVAFQDVPPSHRIAADAKPKASASRGDFQFINGDRRALAFRVGAPAVVGGLQIGVHLNTIFGAVSNACPYPQKKISGKNTWDSFCPAKPATIPAP